MLQSHHFYYTLFICVFLWACGPEKKYEQFLRSKVGTDITFWMRVHAAEALIDNGFSVDVEKIFGDALDEAGAERIGALRTLAKSKKSQKDKYEEIGKEIYDVYVNGVEDRTKLVGLETMGKLNLNLKSALIKRVAVDGESGMQTLAQWVIANTGTATDQEKLASFLFSNDTLQYRYAAYALRFQKQVTGNVYRQMRKKYDSMDRDHPFRVYLSSALFVHAPDDEVARLKSDLLAYRSGPTYARYEVYQALAERGSPEDFELLADSFDDPDDDVRISVAYAYLAIFNELKNIENEH